MNGMNREENEWRMREIKLTILTEARTNHTFNKLWYRLSDTVKWVGVYQNILNLSEEKKQKFIAKDVSAYGSTLARLTASGLIKEIGTETGWYEFVDVDGKRTMKEYERKIYTLVKNKVDDAKRFIELYKEYKGLEFINNVFVA